MEDGKIVREDLIGSPLEEDLKLWRYSGLGQRISNGEVDFLIEKRISQDQIGAMRNLLAVAEAE